MTNLYTQGANGNPWRPITFPLDADIENEIMEEQAQRIAEEVWDDIETAFPEFRLPTSKQASREKRLAHYTAVTDPMDYPFLRDPQYLKKHKQGVYPTLVSPFWLDLYALAPVFQFLQRDFIRLTNFIEDAEE